MNYSNETWLLLIDLFKSISSSSSSFDLFDDDNLAVNGCLRINIAFDEIFECTKPQSCKYCVALAICWIKSTIDCTICLPYSIF